MADVSFLRATSEQDGKRALSRRTNDYAHTTGYKVQRIAGPMSETVLEAAINV